MKHAVVAHNVGKWEDDFTTYAPVLYFAQTHAAMLIVARGGNPFRFWDKASSLEQTWTLAKGKWKFVYRLRVKVEIRTADRKQMQNLDAPQR